WRSTGYTYDAAGRKVSEQTTGPTPGNPNASGGFIGYSYYQDDRVHTQTGRSGETITTSYTPDGQPTSIAQVAPGQNNTITATWYLDGLTRTVDDGGRNEAYTYNGAASLAGRSDAFTTGNGNVADGTETFPHNDAAVVSSITSSKVA